MEHGSFGSVAVSESASDQSLRVLHLTAGSDAGGISRYLHVLNHELVGRGHRPVIAGEVGLWHDLFEDAPWPWVEAPLKGGAVSLWRARGLVERGLRREGFDGRPPVDVIHSHYRRASLVGRWLAKRWRVPLVFTLHLTGIPVGGASGWMSDWGDITHVPSSQARDWLLEEAGLAAERIELIPHGVRAENYPEAGDDARRASREALGLGDRSPVVTFVGRFDDPKNEAWVVDLADLSRQIAPEGVFVMQGEGPHEGELRRSIRKRGLGERVRVLAYGDPKDAYVASDLVVIPSSLEGFSYVTTEAMALGRPVLRTRTAGWAEHVIEGRTGRSCAVDREAFLMAGLEMLNDSEGLRAMGHEAAAHVRRSLTLDRQVDQTVELYKRVIAGARKH
ncbi:MAG: glycosyltransferase family 4 protein [Phycisphaeraceae bacterium]